MKQNTIVGIGILLFIVLSFVNLPFSTNELHQLFLQGLITRLLGAALFAYILFSFGYTSFLKLRSLSTTQWMLLLPAFIIVINNFPFSAYYAGRAIITEPLVTVLLFIVFTISISLFEEFIFRGIILHIMMEKWGKTKQGIFQALLYSALLFAAFHGLNAFSGSSFLATGLQIGYSFLTGMLFGYVYLQTKSIWYAVILHTIYNIGGLAFSMVGTITNQWDVFTIVITSVFSIGCIGFYLWHFRLGKATEFMLDQPLT